MKTFITIMIVGLLCVNLSAQKVIEERVPFSGDELVKLNFDFADNIEFQTWNKNEVYVKVTVSINDNNDNDAYSLKVTENSFGKSFEEKIKDLDKLKTKHTKIDEEDGSHITYCNVDLDIQYVVFLPKSTNIKLETISGNIEGQGLMGEIDLNTISGDIDISMPESVKADLDFSTISGEMYTDFSFAETKKGPYKHHFVKMDFHHELNGGGNSVELTTISGNIYFRKM